MCPIIPRLREDRPGKHIEMNLFCAENDRDKDDPVFLVSDMDDLIALIHRKRTQIEEGFRDMKSLFGFKHLVLKKAQGFYVVKDSIGIVYAFPTPYRSISLKSCSSMELGEFLKGMMSI